MRNSKVNQLRLFYDQEMLLDSDPKIFLVKLVGGRVDIVPKRFLRFQLFLLYLELFTVFFSLNLVYILNEFILY